MKRIFFALIIIAAFLSACGNASEDKDNKQYADRDSLELKIAVQPTFESLPLMIAEENGLFDSCGVKVKLVTYYSQNDCDTALAGSFTDAMITDIIRGKFWEKENKKKLYYATWTNTHYMLVSSKKSRVTKLAQMTDKIMAITSRSVTDMLADSAVMLAGKTQEEMFRVPINNQEIRLNMLLENKMDAAFLQHPYAAEAIKKGGHVLMHGAKAFSGVLAFDESTDINKIEKILKAYDTACDMLNKNGVMQYSGIIEKYIHKDIRKWESCFKDLKFQHSSPVDKTHETEAKKWLNNN